MKGDTSHSSLYRSRYLTGDRVGQPVAPENHPIPERGCVKCGAVALHPFEWDVPVVVIRLDATVERGFTSKRAWYCKYHRKFARKP